ncbi:hypothetical protein SLEP1_g52914 [Rubroshorea leprosula]|uniref:Uncharacterized protein n=1 Tax=Rubroshorea leprosula TaxID=152421 RepID=A0AAV5M7X7_9ROSI|nr:hypothetical protein SLEP1_g52914 [Rubroshorea leprosula]
MWLMEMLKVYQDALDLMKKVIREFPDLAGGKSADTSELWNLS